jgi:hypothetical protein
MLLATEYYLLPLGSDQYKKRTTETALDETVTLTVPYFSVPILILTSPQILGINTRIIMASPRTPRTNNRTFVEDQACIKHRHFFIL